MGSNKSKPRKKKGSQHQAQHLPKVGTKTENERLLHEEQHAVMSQMGLGGSGSAMKTIAIVVIIAIVVGAVLSLALFWR